MKTERLVDDHPWLRIADPSWANPLDSTFAAKAGGRWNPPNSHRTLYLNEDLVTARLNLRAYAAEWPWEPEDLQPDRAPVLVTAKLPRQQTVADAHTPEGVAALGLPRTYPLDQAGVAVTHGRCQSIGEAAERAGLRGIRCRSAQVPLGAGRELAWFPATNRSKARLIATALFNDWYWS